jgi:hypothetical protein
LAILELLVSVEHQLGLEFGEQVQEKQREPEWLLEMVLLVLVVFQERWKELDWLEHLLQVSVEYQQELVQEQEQVLAQKTVA